MTPRTFIPNLITCLNLFSGCLAITCAFWDQLMLSACFVTLSALLDFMDGLMARMLNGFSEMGKQLDSLADIVAFGVAPGAVIFQMFLQDLSLDSYEELSVHILPAIAFFIPVFSALRLARFNIDDRQTSEFIGLPTPANALFLSFLPVFAESNLWGMNGVITSPLFLALTTLVSCFLLVSPLRMFSLKFPGYDWRNNRLRYIFLVISLVLILLFFFNALPLIIILYVVLSLLDHFRLR